MKTVDEYAAEAERNLGPNGKFSPNMENAVAGMGFVALAYLAHLREPKLPPGWVYVPTATLAPTVRVDDAKGQL